MKQGLEKVKKCERSSAQKANIPRYKEYCRLCTFSKTPFFPPVTLCLFSTPTSSPPTSFLFTSSCLPPREHHSYDPLILSLFRDKPPSFFLSSLYHFSSFLLLLPPPSAWPLTTLSFYFLLSSCVFLSSFLVFLFLSFFCLLPRHVSPPLFDRKSLVYAVKENSHLPTRFRDGKLKLPLGERTTDFLSVEGNRNPGIFSPSAAGFYTDRPTTCFVYNFLGRSLGGTLQRNVSGVRAERPAIPPERRRSTPFKRTFDRVNSLGL